MHAIRGSIIKGALCRRVCVYAGRERVSESARKRKRDENKKERERQREREERVGGGGLESVIGMRNVEEEEEGEGEEWPGERNAHNAVISVFDLPISLWGYYVGTLYGARRRARVRACG